MPACKTSTRFVASTDLQLAAVCVFHACVFELVPPPGPSAVKAFGMRLHALPCRAWHPLHAACMLFRRSRHLARDFALVCHRGLSTFLMACYEDAGDIITMGRSCCVKPCELSSTC